MQKSEVYPRKQILDFVDWMEYVMQKHDAVKGDSWKTLDLDILEEKLFEEAAEFLELSQFTGSNYEKMMECVDIANVAMMLFHRYYILWKHGKEFLKMEDGSMVGV